MHPFRRLQTSLHSLTKKILPIFLVSAAVLSLIAAGKAFLLRPFGIDMFSLFWPVNATPSDSSDAPENSSGEKKYIKWVDFDVTADAMRQALRYDVDSYNQDPHLCWIDLLAWLGARYGGDFSRYKSSDLDSLVKKLQDGESMETLTADMKYYHYYQQAYGAVLGGMVGVYDIQIADEQTGEPVWVTKYGLKAFSPIAKNYPYNDYDDFGTSRSYGFKRQHLGHDMMGQVGTPVIIKNYMFSVLK